MNEPPQSAATARFVAVFLLGLVLFNPPLLAVFGVPAMLFGLPLLYLYLFAAWAALIALIGFVAERHSPRNRAED